MTDKEKLGAAFKALRKQGFVARQGFSCCNSCAGYELATAYEAKHGKGSTDEGWKVVYFSRQGNAAFGADGMLQYPLALQWGADPVDNGWVITRALVEAGFGMAQLIWDGTGARTIQVAPEKAAAK